MVPGEGRADLKTAEEVGPDRETGHLTAGPPAVGLARRRQAPEVTRVWLAEEPAPPPALPLLLLAGVAMSLSIALGWGTLAPSPPSSRSPSSSWASTPAPCSRRGGGGHPPGGRSAGPSAPSRTASNSFPSANHRGCRMISARVNSS